MRKLITPVFLVLALSFAVPVAVVVVDALTSPARSDVRKGGL
jgi:hypothetical protein